MASNVRNSGVPVVCLSPSYRHPYGLACNWCPVVVQDEADKAAAANNLGARYTKSRAYLEWAQESGPIVTTVWGDLPFLTGSNDNGACAALSHCGAAKQPAQCNYVSACALCYVKLRVRVVALISKRRAVKCLSMPTSEQG